MDKSPTSQAGGISSNEQKPSVSSSSSVPPSQASSVYSSNPDYYKTKHCMNSQCNGIHHGAYDGISISGESCQPHRHQASMFSSFPQQSSLVSGHDKKDQPSYMMGYQVPLRTTHHPQHTSAHTCHPHHPHQQPVAPTHTNHSHVDRIIQGGTVAVAAQMRSMAMNHYNSGGYNHSSSYYASAPTSSTGSLSYLDYGHHAPSMSTSAAAVQFAAHAQHQRGTSVAANTFQATPHHTKVISPSQAVAYQQAYHQYQQFMQHQGMLHSNHHPVVHQRMIGIPIIHHNHNGGTTSVHQQSRLVPFINHGTHPLPQTHSHGYHNANMVQNSGYPHPPTQPPHADGVTKRPFSDVESTSSSTNANIQQKESKTPLKTTSKDKESKLTFSEKPFKAKQSRSHKSREKPPRFIVGQKKKITTCTTKKFRSSAKSTRIGHGAEASSQWKSTASPITPKASHHSDDEVPGEYIHNTPPNKPLPVEPMIECVKDLDDSETYVPTNEEMIQDLEQLSVCSSLNLSPTGCACEQPVMPCGCGRNHPSIPKPPPGFEHLMRPTFPIEQYDPSLLGNLMASQLKHEVISLSDGMQSDQFKPAYQTCCCKQFYQNENNTDELDLSDEWLAIEKDLNYSLNSWNEELRIENKFEFVIGGVDVEEIVKGCDAHKEFHRNINFDLAPWQSQDEFFKATNKHTWSQK